MQNAKMSNMNKNSQDIEECKTTRNDLIEDQEDHDDQEEGNDDRENENQNENQDQNQKEVDKSSVVQIDTLFGKIEYRSELKLSCASIVQLLHCYCYRVNNQKIEEENKWQQYVYPKLIAMVEILCKNIMEQIKVLIDDKTNDEDVVKINFCGYKNFKLPVVVLTQGVHNHATYGSVNVRPFLKTLKQRLEYLVKSPVPNRLKEDKKKNDTFLKVKDCAKNILDSQVDPLFERWSSLCQEGATIAGINMDDIKKDRTRDVRRKNYRTQESNRDNKFSQRQQFRHQNSYDSRPRDNYNKNYTNKSYDAARSQQPQKQYQQQQQQQQQSQQQQVKPYSHRFSNKEEIEDVDSHENDRWSTSSRQRTSQRQFSGPKREYTINRR